MNLSERREPGAPLFVRAMKKVGATVLLFAGVVVMAGSACNTQAQARPSGAVPIFDDGFEDAATFADLFPPDISRWTTFLLQPAGSANFLTLTAERVHDGAQALKCFAQAFDGVTASKAYIGTTALSFANGDEVWTEMWINVVGGTPPRNVFLWDLEAQATCTSPTTCPLVGTGEICGSPGRRLYLGGTTGDLIRSDLGKWCIGVDFQQTPGQELALPVDEWVRLRTHQRLSEQANGVMKVWQNDDMIIDAIGITLPRDDSVYNSLEIGITANGDETNSHVVYVDDVRVWDQAPVWWTALSNGWQRHATNPVLLPDVNRPDGLIDVAVGDPAVLFDPDDGLWKAWYSTSLKDPSDNYVMALRYSESTDGVTWNAALTSSLETFADPADWNHTNVETPFVLTVSSAPPARRYYMYYAGANQLEDPDRPFPFYQIGLAFSADGKIFTRLTASESPYGIEGLVFRGEDAFPAIPNIGKALLADPTLILKDGQFQMWFSTTAEDALQQPLAFGISYATSTDGIHWTPDPQNPLPSLRRPGDLHSGAAPSVLWNAGQGLYEMWLVNDAVEDLSVIPATEFQAAAYWHATSADAIEWNIDYAAGPDFQWNSAYAAEQWGLIVGVHVMLHDDEYRMYYPAWSALHVPPGFVVPTQTGSEPAVVAVSLASRFIPQPPPVPSVSVWGVVIMAVLLTVFGTIAIRRRLECAE